MMLPRVMPADGPASVIVKDSSFSTIASFVIVGRIVVVELPLVIVAVPAAKVKSAALAVPVADE